MSIDKAKQAAAQQALAYVEDGMIVGLGTGSTANYAILGLADRVRQGLKIRAVATSCESEELARSAGISLIDEFDSVDLTIDGADEVDPFGDLIKGGGGALTREKIVAAASKREIIVVDASKCVETLGSFPLPVEVLPFGSRFVYRLLSDMGAKPSLRLDANSPFVTDNGNYILDCSFDRIEDAETLVLEINAIPGVVENGLFVGLTDLIIVGSESGEFDELEVARDAKA